MSSWIQTLRDLVPSAAGFIGLAIGTGAVWKLISAYQSRKDRHRAILNRLNLLCIELTDASNRYCDVRDRKGVQSNPNELRQLNCARNTLEVERDELLRQLPRRLRRRYANEFMLHFVRPQRPGNLRYCPPGEP